MAQYDASALRIAAAQAGIDLRTLAKALRAGPEAVRDGLTRERVRRALQALETPSAAPEAPAAGRRA